MTSITVSITRNASETRPALFRVLHDYQLGIVRTNPATGEPGLLPQVHPLFDNHFSPFGREWQLLSRALNPTITANSWTQVYGYKTWITNRQGFGIPGDPRANYVTHENENDGLPKVELLTCGGNVLSGRVEGDVLVVDVLDWREPPPTKEWILAHPWFITYATRCDWRPDSTSNPVSLLQSKDAAGNLVPFAHPLIGDKVRFPRITFPMAKLERVTTVPNPYER